jgi:hypothetical protein
MRLLRTLVTQSETLAHLVHPVVLNVKVVHEDILRFRTISDRIGIYRVKCAARKRGQRTIIEQSRCRQAFDKSLIAMLTGVDLDRVGIEDLKKRLTKLISRDQGLGSLDAEQPRC